MNNFTNFIKESRGGYGMSNSLLSKEINSYLKSVKKILPSHIQDIIYLTKKYDLLDEESIMAIKQASKSQLNDISRQYNIPLSELVNLWDAIKGLKSNELKLLPQCQSKVEREMIEKGQLSMDELTIDLESRSGRNAAAKVYMPLVYKIVNSYANSSNMDRQELMSAGVQGLADAINDWKKDSRKQDENTVSFKTYASYRVKQQILNDINKYSHGLSGTSWYSHKMGMNTDTVSIDALLSTDNDKPSSSMEKALGVIDKTHSDDSKEWSKIYDLIEKNFRQREVDVFYRYFGLKGYKKEKSKDIARSLGVSESAIRNVYINKIIMFLRNDKQAISILTNIQDMYNESLMLEMLDMTREEMMDYLVNDDIYILLEELNKWSNKNLFINHLNDSLSRLSEKDANTIIEFLDGDFETVDSQFKKNKKLIVSFLEYMHPTESFVKKTDVALLDYMSELQEFYQKYKK